MQIRFHPAAGKELNRAVDWYIQEAGQRIAAGLVEDFNHLLALIQDHPQIGVLEKSGARKLVFRRYPYTLVYRVQDSAIVVLAVAHHSRRPEYWTGRR